MSRYSPVLDATEFPYSAVVDVEVRYDNGTSIRGTGSVVGNNDVLTSAHMVEPQPGKKIVSIEIQPGFNLGPSTPEPFYGSRTRYHAVDADHDGNISDDEVTHDYALITVDDPDPIGRVVGYFSIQADAAEPGTSIYLDSAGYPRGPQLPGFDLQMIHAFGWEYYDGQTIRHDYVADTGQDWTAAAARRSGSRRTAATMWSASSPLPNSATYITADVFRELRAWMAENNKQHLVGGAGPDTLVGRLNDDRLYGGAGADLLIGKAGNDLLVGNTGADRLHGGGGADRLFGGWGYDWLSGDGGADHLHGNGGNDVLRGGSGRDYPRSGTGAGRPLRRTRRRRLPLRAGRFVGQPGQGLRGRRRRHPDRRRALREAGFWRSTAAATTAC